MELLPRLEAADSMRDLRRGGQSARYAM